MSSIYNNEHPCGFNYRLYRLTDGPTPMTLQEWVEEVELPLPTLLNLFVRSFERVSFWEVQTEQEFRQQLHKMTAYGWIDNPEVHCEIVEPYFSRPNHRAIVILFMTVHRVRYSVEMEAALR